MTSVGTSEVDGAPADYRWHWELRTSSTNGIAAEELMRLVWEGAPAALRGLLRFGWRFGLGLRLGPADPSHILGWHIEERANESVSVGARSSILGATNTLTVHSDVIQWDTEVRFAHLLGRVVWAPARLVHQLIVPWSVRRALRVRVAG